MFLCQNVHKRIQDSTTCRVRLRRARKFRVQGILGLEKSCLGDHSKVPTLLPPHDSNMGHPWRWGLQPLHQASVTVRVQRARKPKAKCIKRYVYCNLWDIVIISILEIIFSCFLCISYKIKYIQFIMLCIFYLLLIQIKSNYKRARGKVGGFAYTAVQGSGNRVLSSFSSSGECFQCNKLRRNMQIKYVLRTLQY